MALESLRRKAPLEPELMQVLEFVKIVSYIVQYPIPRNVKLLAVMGRPRLDFWRQMVSQSPGTERMNLQTNMAVHNSRDPGNGNQTTTVSYPEPLKVIIRSFVVSNRIQTLT